MNCKFCGKESWLSVVFRDTDFCTPSHRRKFHERLQKVMHTTDAANLRSTKTAGPVLGLSPAATFAGFSPSLQLESTPVLRAPRVSGLALNECRLEFKSPSNAELQALASVTEESLVSAPQVVVDRVSNEPSSPVLVMCRPVVQDSRMQRLTDLITNLRNHARGNELGQALRAC